MQLSYRQLPNLLSILRILLTPVIICCLYQNIDFWYNMAAFVFILACLTDYFDGYLARKYHLKSAFGKLMDPVADKVLVNSILVMLIALKYLDPFIVILFIIRDTLVQGVRSVAASENLIIEAVNTGKWKTTLQMAGIIAMLVRIPPLMLHNIGYALLWGAVILSLISGYQYVHCYYLHQKTKN